MSHHSKARDIMRLQKENLSRNTRLERLAIRGTLTAFSVFGILPEGGVWGGGGCWQPVHRPADRRRHI